MASLSRSSVVRKAILWSLAGIVLFLIVVWIAVTQPTLWGNTPARTATVSPARLETHVRMLAETFSPRDWQHPENLDRAAEYIAAEFRRTSATVTEQPFEMDSKSYRNVIAPFGPETAERIVVGAHYDAHGEFPGADDNASGVAGLIELAFLLSDAELPLRVELVAYTLEETRRPTSAAVGRGYNGSAVHARSLKEEAASIRIMISLEMIGYFSDEQNSQGYPSPILRWFYPTRGDFIVIAGRLREGSAARRTKKAMQAASALPVYSFNAPSFAAGIDRSDHASYWEQGYPALMVTDTAFNRNANYHTAYDTPDRLDYNRMAMVVEGVSAAVMAFSR